MEKGDIVKIKLRFGGYAIGVVSLFDKHLIEFSTYLYENRLFFQRGHATGYIVMPLEPIDDLTFKNALLSESYSYDVETKTIIHEL